MKGEYKHRTFSISRFLGATLTTSSRSSTKQGSRSLRRALVRRTLKKVRVPFLRSLAMRSALVRLSVSPGGQTSGRANWGVLQKHSYEPSHLLTTAVTGSIIDV